MFSTLFRSGKTPFYHQSCHNRKCGHVVNVDKTIFNAEQFNLLNRTNSKISKKTIDTTCKKAIVQLILSIVTKPIAIEFLRKNAPCFNVKTRYPVAQRQHLLH
jgi:hypothetical protein